MNLAAALTHLLNALQHARLASRETRERVYAAIDRWVKMLSTVSGVA